MMEDPGTNGTRSGGAMSGCPGPVNDAETAGNRYLFGLTDGKVAGTRAKASQLSK